MEDTKKVYNEKLRRYILLAIDSGKSREEIIDSLVKVGWDEKLVTKYVDTLLSLYERKIIKEEEKTEKSIEKLYDYITSLLKKGVHKEQVRASLINAGWPKEIVNSLIMNITSNIQEKSNKNQYHAKAKDHVTKSALQKDELRKSKKQQKQSYYVSNRRKPKLIIAYAISVIIIIVSAYILFVNPQLSEFNFFMLNEQKMRQLLFFVMILGFVILAYVMREMQY